MNNFLLGRHHWIAVALVVGCLAGCSRPTSGTNGNVKVTDITVGRALAQDDTIAEDSRTTNFWTTDAFYVSVQAEPVAVAAEPGGSPPSATLTARWTGPDGAVAAESDDKTISPTGPMVVAFQASKPDRWAEGDYKVEILVDGVPVGSKDFNAR